MAQLQRATRKPRHPNPVAPPLRSPHLRPRVRPSKRTYDRKRKEMLS
jgi:hypothetical protein